MNKTKKFSYLNKRAVIIVVLVILLATLFIVKRTHVTKLSKPEGHPPAATNEPTVEQKQQEAATNADIKKQAIEAQDNVAPTTDKTIELSGQQETNNTVTVFTKLRGYSSGSCELTVTNGALVTVQTADVIYQPEFSSCAGFSVPIDSVAKGVWMLKLTVTSDGTSETKNISLEVK